jgi:tetratricopeptide (TPR) repeat protein
MLYKILNCFLLTIVVFANPENPDGNQIPNDNQRKTVLKKKVAQIVAVLSSLGFDDVSTENIDNESPKETIEEKEATVAAALKIIGEQYLCLKKILCSIEISEIDETYFYDAINLMKNEKFPEARKIFSNFIELKDGKYTIQGLEALFFVGMCLFYEKKYERALTVLTHFDNALTPNELTNEKFFNFSSESKRMKALSYSHIGRLEDAKAEAAAFEKQKQDKQNARALDVQDAKRVEESTQINASTISST